MSEDNLNETLNELANVEAEEVYSKSEADLYWEEYQKSLITLEEVKKYIIEKINECKIKTELVNCLSEGFFFVLNKCSYEEELKNAEISNTIL